jgi:hypothetical protein
VVQLVLQSCLVVGRQLFQVVKATGRLRYESATAKDIHVVLQAMLGDKGIDPPQELVLGDPGESVDRLWDILSRTVLELLAMVRDEVAFDVGLRSDMLAGHFEELRTE